MARDAGDRSGEAHWLRLTGATFQIRGNIAQAREYYEKSLSIRRELDQRPDMVVLTTGIGIASLNLRDYGTSRRYLEEAARLAAGLKQPAGEGRAWQSLGQLEKVQQHYPESIAAFTTAV